MAAMPAGAAGDASVAAGYLFAPLLLRRGPMGAWRAPRQHTCACDAQGLSARNTRCNNGNRAGKQLGAPQQGGDALPAAALAAMPARVQRALGLAAPTPAPAVAAAAGSSAWSVSRIAPSPLRVLLSRAVRFVRSHPPPLRRARRAEGHGGDQAVRLPARLNG
jgi:hypothetical protein